MCGIEVRQGLFSWPCLLFKSGVSSSWTIVGYKNMQGFLSDYQTFDDVSSDGSPPAISCVVKETSRKYGDTLKDKLIIQTFLHCAAHRLNLLLCQPAPSVLVKVFFANFSAFCQGYDDWASWGHTPQYLQICEKVGQKADMLEES